MVAMNSKLNFLTKRDRMILSHIAEFNLTTIDIVKPLFFENLERAAAVSTLRRLREKYGLVEADKFHGQRKKYFRLTRAGAKVIGKILDKEELGDEKAAASFARLQFLCINPQGIVRTLCKTSEHPDMFKSPNKKAPKVDFYIAENKLDNPDSPSIFLGAIIVDFNSHPKRIVSRCVKHSQNFIRRGLFAEIMKAGRFEITVLTGTKLKKDALDLILNRELRRLLRIDVLKHGLHAHDRFPVVAKTVVIPGINMLVPQARNKRASK